MLKHRALYDIFLGFGIGRISKEETVDFAEEAIEVEEDYSFLDDIFVVIVGETWRNTEVEALI